MHQAMCRAGGGGLRGALALGNERVVAFTGGGGKTTAMFQLARELAAERVLVTTTTKIWVPRPDQAQLCVVDELGEAMRRLKVLWHGGVRALGTAITSEGKLRGIPPEWAEPLTDVADRVLVEADGAAGKPLTVPRQHEPVIPACTALLVPVAGMDAVGALLDTDHVHRAPEMAARLSKSLGEPLTARDVAEVMLSRWGNIKGALPHTRIVPLVNKVDALAALRSAMEQHDNARIVQNRDGLVQAEKLAKELLPLGVSRVVLACLAGERPSFEILEADGRAARW